MAQHRYIMPVLQRLIHLHCAEVKLRLLYQSEDASCILQVEQAVACHEFRNYLHVVDFTEISPPGKLWVYYEVSPRMISDAFLFKLERAISRRDHLSRRATCASQIRKNQCIPMNEEVVDVVLI